MVDKREILSRIDELPENHRNALIQALNKYNIAMDTVVATNKYNDYNNNNYLL